jgi:hypothetical protein
VDLNAACWLKRTKALKRTQPSCPGIRDLNWTGKGLMIVPCIIRSSMTGRIFSQVQHLTLNLPTMNIVLSHLMLLNGN